MSIQLQLRHDTSTNWATVAPASGEAVADSTSNRLRLGDGSTNGGWPHALETRASVADANYAALPTDRLIAFATLTAARTVTLPAAAYPTGARLTVIDETGACSPVLSIAINRAGSDTINGLTSVALASAYAQSTFESNGANAWTMVGASTPPATINAVQGANGSLFRIVVLEQLVSGLSGGSVIASTQIPAGALVLACASRVVTAISGATSFSVGYTGYANAFGSSLAVAAGSTNEGLLVPDPFWAAQNLILTASGGSFSSGAVRLALFYMTFSAPAM